MTTFRVRHRVSYSYDRPVEFGLHQLMVRPRDGNDMRLLASILSVTPRADVRWVFDTFGNSIALLSFSEAADELVIQSELTLRRYGYDDPVPRLARHTGPYPFAYEAEDGVDLAPMLTLQHSSGCCHVWLTSMPRSCSRSSTFRSDSGNRTFNITARRMVSGLVLKQRNGERFVIRNS